MFKVVMGTYSFTTQFDGKSTSTSSAKFKDGTTANIEDDTTANIEDISINKYNNKNTLYPNVINLRIFYNSFYKRVSEMTHKKRIRLKITQ